VAHRVVAYPHDPAAESYGQEAAEALGVDPDVVFKTLVAAVEGGDHRSDHVVGIVPVDARLDVKALASASQAKRATMAEPADAERLTGYVRGGISPLGQRKRLATFLDSSAKTVDLIYVSGGRRGLDIALAPGDLVAVLDATYASIAVRG